MEKEPSIRRQRAFYDDRWADAGYENRLKLQRAAAILNELVHARLAEPRIADLGCGSGWLTAILGHFGPATGFELSHVAVEQARHTYPHCDFQQVDLTGWEYPRAAFDVVVSSEVLEHFSDQAGHIRQASAMLRRGGYLILTTPNADTLWSMPDRQRNEWTQQPIENWVTARQLRTLLVKAGMRVNRITTVIPNFGVGGLRRLVNSHRLRTLASSLGLSRAHDAWRLRAGYGLHLVALASKNEERA